MASAENGVSADKIVFGQTAAFEGPASGLGIGMRDGLNAAFKEINDKGGINGRKIELISINDGYEPEAAAANTKKLINEGGVFMLIGGVGTPTAKVIEPITTEAKVPFFGPFTGAGFLRSANKRYVVNVRGSYAAEAWIEYLTTEKNASRIAILYQDDSFGQAGLSGVNAAMEKRGMMLVGEGKYTRNTTDVDAALSSIQASGPDAIVMVGAYKPIATFIKKAKDAGLGVPMLNISFVGSKKLAEELGEYADGVIITQVVPFPYNPKTLLVREYISALVKLDKTIKPGFVSLEGYLVRRLAGAFNIGGTALEYALGDNQGMDSIFFTRIRANGSFVDMSN